ncbi:MAG: tetratricopeptide repeat protein [Planctomycetota bacterium]
MNIANDTDRLLSLSREAQWAFPSSSGRPVPLRPPEWLSRVSAEQRSFVETARSLIDRNGFDLATELAANVWRLWILKREEAAGREFLAMVLDHAGNAQPTRWRALALYGDSLLAFRLGDLESSRARSEAALEAARAACDAEAEALALLALSRVELTQGDHGRARAHAARSKELASGFDPALGQSPLHMLAQATRLGNDLDEAAALFLQSLELNRRLGDQGMIAVELHNLGHVELRLGHVDVAEPLFEEAAAFGDDSDPYSAAMRLFNRASIAFARDDRENAASWLRQARSTLHDAGIEPASDDAEELDRLDRQLTGSADGH